MRGGDYVTVDRAYITKKAKAQYAELCPGGDPNDLIPGNGDRIMLFADGSPYFIHEVGPWRVTLCVADRHTLEDGLFGVVSVQRRKRKN